MTNNKLADAIAFATVAHKHCREKNGDPYILHPIRVMDSVKAPEEKMTAILHDVVEDTAVTLDDLRAEGFPEAVVEAVGLLSRDPDNKEPGYYDLYIERIGGNTIARRVKLADLTDNMNITRLPTLREKDVRRLEKYCRVWLRLSAIEADS